MPAAGIPIIEEENEAEESGLLDFLKLKNKYVLY